MARKKEDPIKNPSPVNMYEEVIVTQAAQPKHKVTVERAKPPATGVLVQSTGWDYPYRTEMRAKWVDNRQSVEVFVGGAFGTSGGITLDRAIFEQFVAACNDMLKEQLA